MWDSLINWENLKNKILGGSLVRGSQEEADEITSLLLEVDEVMRTGLSTLFNEAEIELIQESLTTGTSGVARSLLNYSFNGTQFANDDSSTKATIIGGSFENRMDEVVRMLFTDQSYRVGGSKFRASSPINISVKQVVGNGNAFKGLKTTIESSKVKLKDPNQLWDIVGKDIMEDFKAQVGNFEYVIKQDSKGNVKDVILTQVSVDRKIDLVAPYAKVQVVKQEGPHLNRLGNLLRGRTFSLKNIQGGSPDVGNANWYRRIGSFYAYATGDNNFANIATFIYSTTDKGKNPDGGTAQTKKYLNTVRFLYEVLGLGQGGSATGLFTKGRLVDYLVVNKYGLKSPSLTIISTKDLLSDVFNGGANYFNPSGTLKI